MGTFSKSEVWDKVPEASTLLIGDRAYQNFLITKCGRGRRKPPCRKQAWFVQSFRYSTCLWWTDGRTDGWTDTRRQHATRFMVCVSVCVWHIVSPAKRLNRSSCCLEANTRGPYRNRLLHLDGVHIGAIWRIRLTDACAATVPLFPQTGSWHSEVGWWLNVALRWAVLQSLITQSVSWCSVRVRRRRAHLARRSFDLHQ